MSAPNDLNFDTETYLLFSIYYGAYVALEGIDESATTCLEHLGKAVHATGQVLEWLGFTTISKSSPLGWKPSHALMSLIAEPRQLSQSKKVFPYPKDNEVFDLILNAALGDLEMGSNIPGFVRAVLYFLGLAKETEWGFVPAQRLRELACARPQEERQHQRDEQRVNP
jgi:hypothetical protein